MIRAAALLSLLALALLAAPALANTVCAPRSTLVTRLLDTYGETVQGLGIAANGAVMEVFASDKTGTWTVTVTLPNGFMCLLATGGDYERVAAKPNL